MTKNLKNEHAQALGSLKKGKKEKPSPHKKEACRSNLEKAREARRVKQLQKQINENPKH